MSTKYLEKTKRCPIPTKWLFFFTFVHLPLFFLSNLIQPIPAAEKLANPLSDGERAVTLLTIILFSFYAIFTAITFVSLLRLKPSGFIIVTAFLIAEPACFFIASILNGSSQQAVSGCAFMYAAWVLPNYLYFKNRKFLFYVTNPQEVVHKLKDGSWVCPSCNTKLMAGDICNSCGFKIMSYVTDTQSAENINEEDSL